MWPLSNDLFRLLHQLIFLLIAKNFIIFWWEWQIRSLKYRSLQNYFRSLKARGIFDASDLKTKECQPPVSDENNRSPKTFVPILIHLTGGPKPAALSDQKQLVSTKFVTAKLAMASICTESQISFAKFRFLNCCMDAFANDTVSFLFFLLQKTLQIQVLSPHLALQLIAVWR